MSEKRFEVSFDEKIIVDTYGVNKNTTEYDIHKSCDLINSLYENNEQLRKQIRNINYAIEKAVSDLMRTEEVYLADFDIVKRISEYEKEFNEWR